MQISKSQLLFRWLLIGFGATLFMDIWALVAQASFGIPPSNFSMVGRWISHMPSGVFTHDSIRQAAPAENEAMIGWTAHYLIGLLFAAAFLVIGGAKQVSKPSLLIALTIGVLTVVFPFFLLQPALGAGVMAANRPDPTAAQLKSLMSHASFGLGLYLACKLQRSLFPSFLPQHPQQRA